MLLIWLKIYIHNLKFKMLIVTEYYIININISQCYLVEQMNCLLTFFLKYGARVIQTILANLVIFLVPFQKHLLIPYLRPLSQETIILFNKIRWLSSVKRQSSYLIKGKDLPPKIVIQQSYHLEWKSR